ncbi:MULTISPECIES: FAD-dependent oxidoreductase [Actinomadura]|uniref:FAD-dependent oxidoreductase n=1 Tax=Actinomadura yumaensis TaxID=111807 RepID=A0ABW2CN47_9ACTN|nr:FAD-dependent monooxygenase [Actinomadura sp. J1-007]MWK36759.1 NAD(P)-binding protein [Actinomadura sp. J1-007]
MDTPPKDPRVVIVGGGIGGLALAQGLRQAGFGDVTVYERDASPRGRMQGYRLRISPEGEQAVKACLPARARELLAATSNQRGSEGLVAYDERLNEMWSPDFTDPRADDPDKVDAVDRVTLRRVLLAGLGGAVRWGERFTHLERSGPEGRVVAHFAGGHADTADVLIAADGANSRVRGQLRPDDRHQDLGVRAILSRTPRAKADAAGLPEVLRDRFVNVTGSNGLRLALMPMVFRNPPREAAERIWPGLGFDPTEDYYMSVFSVHQDHLGLGDEAFFAMDGTALRDLVLERTADWHPDLRGVFAHAQPEETHPLALRATIPVEAWSAGNVIPLGDAAHTMPPTGGVGANTALRDAAGLTRALASAFHGGRDLAEAVAEYERDMVRYATEAIDTSLRIAKWSMKKIDVDGPPGPPAPSERSPERPRGGAATRQGAAQ